MPFVMEAAVWSKWVGLVSVNDEHVCLYNVNTLKMITWRITSFILFHPRIMRIYLQFFSLLVYLQSNKSRLLNIYLIFRSFLECLKYQNYVLRGNKTKRDLSTITAEGFVCFF